jgi:protein-S-isoprenylcysteine O-methyltransferase Ste14
MGWAFLLVYLAFIVIAFLALDPSLIRERSRLSSGAKRPDLVLASLSFVFLYPATVIVSGLDLRLAWSSPISLVGQVSGLAGFCVGYGFALWAMWCNPFFSTFVRIQHERAHHVVASGPYAFIRHPGYSGTIAAHLALPIALGSIWALVPALCGSLLFVVRAFHEDRTLQAELRGYRDYARRVPWRLLPGIW